MDRTCAATLFININPSLQQFNPCLKLVFCVSCKVLLWLFSLPFFYSAVPSPSLPAFLAHCINQTPVGTPQTSGATIFVRVVTCQVLKNRYVFRNSLGSGGRFCRLILQLWYRNSNGARPKLLLETSPKALKLCLEQEAWFALFATSGVLSFSFGRLFSRPNPKFPQQAIGEKGRRDAYLVW
jgi:hypothetical protein